MFNIMESEMKSVILSIAISIIFLSAYGQSVSVTVDVESFAPVEDLCTGVINTGNGSYDCKTIIDTWLSGGTTTYSFQDPVPPGNEIMSTSLVFKDVNCDAFGSIHIEDTDFMFMLSGTTCNGLTEPCGNTINFDAAFQNAVSFDDYNYGGNNKFDIMLEPGFTGLFCFSSAEITFNYRAIEPAVVSVPTIGEWGLIVLCLSMLILGIIILGERKVIITD